MLSFYSNIIFIYVLNDIGLSSHLGMLDLELETYRPVKTYNGLQYNCFIVNLLFSEGVEF